jgi:hypothetical protein
LELLPSKIKRLLRQKNTLDNRDRTVKVPPIDMKNNPLTSVLLGVLTVSALASVVLCWRCVINTRELQSLQNQISQVRGNRGFINLLLRDTLEYSQKHPAIDPLLESLRLKAGKTDPTATNKLPNK